MQGHALWATYNNRLHGSLNGSKLESVREEKDLGVHISNDLKWKNTAVRLQPKQTKYLD